MKNSNKYRKWLNWGILNIAFMLTFFHRFSISAVADTLATDLSLSSTQLANLASMYFYSYALMQVPFGVLASKYGGKKVSFMGMVLCATGAFLFGMTENLYILYACRILVGIGSATVFISVMDVQSQWFDSSEFTKLTGFTSLIGNIGGIAAAAPFAFLVGYIGWKSSFKLIGVITVFVLALIWFGVKENAKESDTNIEQESAEVNVKGILLSGKFISIVLLSLTAMGGLMSFQGLWIIPYIKDTYGMTNESSAVLAMLISVGIILASMFMGTIEKVIGSKNKVATLSGAIFGISLITMLLLGKYKLIAMAAMFFMGGSANVAFIIAISMAKDMLPRSKSSLGISIINVAAFTGTIVLNALTGKIKDVISISNPSTNGYSLILVSYLAFIGVAIITLMFTSMRNGKVVVEKAIIK